MGPLGAIASCYRKILDFSGRARRAEYWWFFVYLIFAQFLYGFAVQYAAIAYVVANPALLDVVMRLEEADPQMAIEQIMGTPGLLYPWAAALVVHFLIFGLPQLSVTIRRLHDTDRTGWLIFVPLLASIAAIGIMVFGTLVSMVSSGGLMIVLAAAFLPLVASIWFIVLICLPGTHGDNRFGPDPVPNRRRRRAPSHPAFAPQLPPEERAEAAAMRRAEIKEYYKKRVLPGIQKA